MMELIKEESGQTGTLNLDGALDIQHASELKEILLNGQEGVEHLQVKLEGVTSADVSGLQLLCSAHRRAAKLNKRMTAIGSASAPLQQAVKDAGYERELGCSFDRDQTCLWRKG